jgi:hypothetical protein
LILSLLPDGLVQQSIFFDFGLHSSPENMRTTLQEAIDAIDQPSLVVLGYGLCGKGTSGLHAGKHTLLLPRVHDCIALLLGSRHAYHSQAQAEPGTYYLSRGWLEAGNDRTCNQIETLQYGAHPLAQYEKYEAQYGPETADWLMLQLYQHYQRLALVTHNEDEMLTLRPQALEIAQYCERLGMRYEEIVGSDRYVRRLIEVIISPNQADDEFLVVPPGGEIRQTQFDT